MKKSIQFGSTLVILMTPALWGGPPIELTPYYVYGDELDWDRSDYVGSSEVQSRPPVDLAESLSSLAPGISSIRRGPVAQDLQIRGMGRDNIDIQIDGANVYGACPNRMDPPAFHVSARQVERVRITRGPFNVTTASGLAGAVEVETIDPGGTQTGALQLGAGSNAYRFVTGSLSGPLSGIPLMADVSWQRAEPYEDGSGTPFTEFPSGSAAYQGGMKNHRAYEITNLLGKAVIADGHGGMRQSITVAYDDKEDILYPALAMDTVKGITRRIGWAGEKQMAAGPLESLKAEAHYAEVYHDMTDTFRVSSTEGHPMWGMFQEPLRERILDQGYFMRTVAETKSAGLKLTAELEFQLLKITSGIEHRYRYWAADNQVGRLENLMIAGVHTHRSGAFMRGLLEHGDWLLDTGVRLGYDYANPEGSLDYLEQSRAQDFTTAQEVLPAGYILLNRRLSQSLLVYGGLGYATRPADAQESFLQLERPMNNPGWLGNPNLDATGQVQWDTGMRWRGESMTLEASVFISRVFDYIYLDRYTSPEGSFTSYKNIDVEMWGWEASLRWEFARWAKLEVMAGMQDSKKTSGKDRDVAEVAPPTGSTNLIFNPMENLTLKWGVEGALHQNDVDSRLGEMKTPSWWTSHLRVSWTFLENGQIGIDLENLFDRTYRRHLSYLRDPFRSSAPVNEPGREVIVRAGWDF